jgi:hypothetical protein
MAADPNVNPYASSGSFEPLPLPTGPTGPRGPIGAALPWRPTEAIVFGWETIKREPIAILVFFVAMLIGNAISTAGSLVNVSLSTNADPELRSLGEVVYWVTLVVNIPLSLYIQMGLMRYVLKLARGEAASFADLFAGGPFLTMLGVSLLLGLGVGFGTLLLVVPGVILALGWALVQYIAVDRRLGVIETFGVSWRATHGHKGQILLLFLLAFLVMLAGLLACCIGTFVAMPIIHVALAYLYLKLTGEEPAMVAR